MIKKLTLSIVMIASLMFFAGAAMTAFAEEGSNNATVSISADASVDTGNNDWEDNDNFNVHRNGDGSMDDNNAWFRGRADVREQRNEVRQERKNIFDIFKAKKAEIRGDMKIDIRGLIESRWKMIGVRFDNIVTRIESRIAKLEADGKDVAGAKDHLAKGKISLASAQAKAKVLADAAVAGTLTREAAMQAKVGIKADLETAKAELKLSVEAIIALQPDMENENTKEHNKQ